jgi:hypothetical protein
MSFFLSIIVFLTPIAPLSDIPPTSIWLGKGIPIIQGEKLKPGDEIKTIKMGLSVYDFVRLKGALESSTDLCQWAIEESVKECMSGMQTQIDIAINRESSQVELIQAYEHRLKQTETALSKSEDYNKILLYVSGGLAVLAASTTTLFFIRK